MGKKASDMPAPDPRLYDAIDKQVKQGDDMISFLKDAQAENTARQDKQDALNEKVTDQQMRLADSAEARSNDAYNFYKTEGRPVISQALKDAQDYDSTQNIADARSRATADAQAGYDSAQQQNNRMLARMGVNPNSMKFQALNNQVQLQKAAGVASAGNNAENQRRTGAITLRQQAGNLASGMPAQSMGFAGQASGMGSAASGVGASGINSALSGQSAYTSGMASAGNQFGSAASQYNNLYQQQSQNAQFQAKQASDSSAGIGQLAGMAGMAAMMMADGGKVKGPGTGISDEVPALNADNGQRIQLSNGEYVIPADVVRKVGEDKFDQLLAKYHTPAAKQRAGNLGRH